ncbi:methyltransferase [Marichromatium purpuratum 984]|uniref:Methyltransferase n=1 Tax=Marichromatium purpuratum 984 TaxID=765910 RepID=W0DZ63_MARPU|nr:class I SAM-dependent methyltransferase [Marichromatium purpuratum]AHF03722.1 methyltransferase [Marichromatium purpuratum 984]
MSDTRASTADRHRLYELAVQAPEAEIDLLDQLVTDLRGRPARRLREDFCGSAAIAAAWVRRRPDNQALGIDLDAAVLDWARTHTLAALAPEARARLALRQADVREAATAPVDLVVAMNFSYWLLRSRETLGDYFRAVRRALAPDGVFLLDVYGGYDAPRVIREARRVADPEQGDFDYIWEQARFDPISSDLECHIHFAFDDGSRLERAFSYQWRLWTLPELRELLAEAGFGEVGVYWQGWDAEGEPDGDFVAVERGEPDAGWIAYLGATPAR